MKLNKSLIAGAVAAAGAMFSAPAFSFDLTNCGTDAVPVPCPYVTYGDGNSYALMVNATLYSYATAADGTVADVGTGPTNPFYVTSTPGAIKDLTVIGTGSDGVPVTTNYPGADDAYPTPNSDGIVYFSTGTTADPGGINEFTGDGGGTWDVTLSALSDFMGDEESLIFFFNNNQTNSGDSTNQNLAAWAQITITDGTGAVVAVYDFTNDGGVFDEPGGGDLNGSPGAYTHDPLDGLDSPFAGTNLATDYVKSGGALCYTGDSLATFAQVSCDTPGASVLNSNLGANQAAYAIVFPELDAFLAGLTNLDGYSMNVNLRFGCDPDTVNPDVNCIGRDLNNGYEQVFLSTAARVTLVPLPSTALLLGIGLLGVAGLTGRKMARR